MSQTFELLWVQAHWTFSWRYYRVAQTIGLLKGERISLQSLRTSARYDYCFYAIVSALNLYLYAFQVFATIKARDYNHISDEKTDKWDKIGEYCYFLI